jgi:zinc protease
VGDIDSQTAFSLANRYFGTWRNPPKIDEGPGMSFTESTGSMLSRKRAEAEKPLVQRILVIDLPNSGQAAVAYVKHLQFAGRIGWDDEKKQGYYSENYFPALVMNSILGGGYSSRLNQEIRIKRGLSYGAGSSISWRSYDSRFSTRTQTKNESASEVAELVTQELKKLMNEDILSNELVSRKAVLTGNYGRNIETNGGLVALLSELYSDWQPALELNNYTKNVDSVSIEEIKQFASSNLVGGDIIIVGDYAKFKDDLAKRFPNMKVDVIKADELDLSKENLRK